MNKQLGYKTHVVDKTGSDGWSEKLKIEKLEKLSQIGVLHSQNT